MSTLFQIHFASSDGPAWLLVQCELKETSGIKEWLSRMSADWPTAPSFWKPTDAKPSGSTASGSSLLLESVAPCAMLRGALADELAIRQCQLMPDKLQLSPEQFLALLEAVIREVPDFKFQVPLTDRELKWLGRADALLGAAGTLPMVVNFRAARADLNSYGHDRSKLLIPLHDAYSRIELLAPAESRGTYIPAGDTWNGYAALIRVLQKECNDLLVVDPYLNSTMFIEFAPHAMARLGVRCLTSQRPENHLGLLAAAKKWDADQISASKHVEVRYAPPRSLHDRLLILDASEVWLVSQSLKDIAKQSPASLSKAEAELGLMKAQHYDALWNHSLPIA